MATTITAIEIENFKGIGRRGRVEMKPITHLSGPNSGGKSTLLHALLYLRDLLIHGDPDVHHTQLGSKEVDLGGFLNYVHQHNPRNVVRMKLDIYYSDTYELNSYRIDKW
jgi:AAA15 family ATPase/GTPase